MTNIKNSLNVLEEYLQNINVKIQIEQNNEQQRIKKADGIDFLKHSINKAPKLMLQILIQEIVLFNDKVEIYDNYINIKNPDDSRRDSLCIEYSDVSNQSPPLKNTH